MVKTVRALVGAFLLLGSLWAQSGSCKQDIALGNNGKPLAGALIQVCTDGSCAANAPLYSDTALSVPISNPFTTPDGNYSFCAAPGDYRVVVSYGSASVTTDHVRVGIKDATSLLALANTWTAAQNLSAGGTLAGTFTGNPTWSGNHSFTGTNTHSGTDTFKTLNQVRYADQFTGSDIGAKINAAITDLGTGGGRIIVPKGTYTWSTAIAADLSNNIDIACDGGMSGGSSTATVLTWTGSTTPILARSSNHFHLSGCAIWWNNAAMATGTVIDFTHTGTGCGGGGCDSVFAEVDHNQFRASGSVITVGQIINADKLISSRFHDNVFANYQYAIIGPPTNASYSTVIYIESNHFDSSSGTCVSGAHVANPHQGWTLVNNTFEMGSGTCSVIGYTGGFTSTSGIDISGSWIGDNVAGATIPIFNVQGAGWNVHGNFIAGGSSNLMAAFQIASGVIGFTAIGNHIQNVASVLNFTVNANAQKVLVKGNEMSTGVTAFAVNAPASGELTDTSNLSTEYGQRTISGAFTANSTFTSALTTGVSMSTKSVMQFFPQATTGSGLPALAAGQGFGLQGHSGTSTTGVLFVGDGTGTKQFEWGTWNGTTYGFKGAFREDGQVIFAGGKVNAQSTMSVGASGTPGATITAIYLGAGTLTYTAIAANSCQEQTLTVTNATSGKVCWASPGSFDPGANLSWSCRVSAAATASVRVCNNTTGSVTPTAGSWNVWVIQ